MVGWICLMAGWGVHTAISLTHAANTQPIEPSKKVLMEIDSRTSTQRTVEDVILAGIQKHLHLWGGETPIAPPPRPDDCDTILTRLAAIEMLCREYPHGADTYLAQLVTSAPDQYALAIRIAVLLPAQDAQGLQAHIQRQITNPYADDRTTMLIQRAKHNPMLLEHVIASISRTEMVSDPLAMP